MTMHDETWADLLLDHALHVLSDEEQGRVREHVAGCPICQARMRELEEAMTALALGAPAVALPEGFTARLIARAGALDAVTTAPPPAPPASETARPRALWRAHWWRPARLAPAVAIIALAIALVSGWQAFHLRQQLAAERQQLARLTALLAAQPASVRELRGTGVPQAGGRLVVEPDEQIALLAARDLPSLPPGHVYQVWLVRDGQRVSGGTFTVEDGSGWLLVRAPEPLATYQIVGITVEPAPGSPGPTTPQVMGGTL